MLLATLEEPRHTLKLPLVHERSHGGRLRVGIAHAFATLLHRSLIGLDEFVVDALLNIYTTSGEAYLARVRRDGIDTPIHGIVEVRVVKDDRGALAPELESNALEVALGSGFLDAATGIGGSGEADLVDLHVACEERSRAAVTCQDLEDTGWETGFLDERREGERGEGRLLGGLEYEYVPGGQRRACLHGFGVCENGFPYTA